MEYTGTVNGPSNTTRGINWSETVAWNWIELVPELQLTLLQSSYKQICKLLIDITYTNMLSGYYLNRCKKL